MQARIHFKGRGGPGASAKVVEYLHEHVPTGAMIETYESELFLLLTVTYTIIRPLN
ncbi:MAG: hypothetical protein U0361_16350 [Nitrospiraceae bacterium]